MSEGLKKLKAIGAKKIYETTHIPVGHVQAIIDENFEDLSRLQFLGFISILEREYGCDLSDVKAKGELYFDEQEASKEVVINESIYKAPSKKRNFMLLYAILAATIFIIAVVVSMSSSQESIKSDAVVNDEIIEEVHESILQDANTTTAQATLAKEEASVAQNDTNDSVALISESTDKVVETKKSVEEKAIKNTTFVIAPRKRVWLGYIDLTKQKRYQKTFKTKLKLNPNEEWLLFFGHGNINIITDKGTEKFSSRNVLRLYYKDGIVRQVTPAEFKKLNGGRKW